MIRVRAIALLAALCAVLAACGGTKTVTTTVSHTTTTAAPAAPVSSSGPVVAQSIPYDAKTGVPRQYLPLLEGISAQPPPAGSLPPVPRFGVSKTEGLNARCIPGYSFPGCSLVPRAGVPGKKLAPRAGPEYPDVSDWQGHPGWGSVFAWQRSHQWHPFGIFKLGEYTYDPDAGYNAQQLGRAGLPKVGYWFVRNTGCSTEAARIHQAVIWWGVKFVWLDIEVPEAAGYANCLLHAVAPYVAVGIYTGIGTWTGDHVASSTRQWNAAYNFSGPSYGNLWCSHCALIWQFTDGTYAARTLVPGIGYDDVNLDLGFEKLMLGGGVVSVPGWLVVMDHHVRVFHLGHSVIRAREYDTLKTAILRGCHLGDPKRRACVYSALHLHLLLARLDAVARRFHHGSLHYDHARGRHYRMSVALAQR